MTKIEEQKPTNPWVILRSPKDTTLGSSHLSRLIFLSALTKPVTYTCIDTLPNGYMMQSHLSLPNTNSVGGKEKLRPPAHTHTKLTATTSILPPYRALALPARQEGWIQEAYSCSTLTSPYLVTSLTPADRA